MIIIRHVGAGIGNQLNLIAIYTFLKKRYKNVKIQDHDGIHYLYDGKDDLDSGLRDLHADYEKSTKWDELIMNLTFAPTIWEGKVNEILNIHGNAYLSGYFSNAWPGFDETMADDVRAAIKFFLPDNPKNISILGEIQNNETSVSVHFRRGDYLLPENENLNITSDAYYKAAFDYVLSKYKSPVFYFFSDDKEYLYQYIKYNGYEDVIDYRIIDWNTGNQGINDLLLMSKCKVNIGANSSFSTWAALLNDNVDKEVIKPQRDGEYVISRACKDFIYINAKTGEIIDKTKCRIGYDESDYGEEPENKYSYYHRFVGLLKRKFSRSFSWLRKMIN